MISWSPDEVIDEHKKWARAMWALLLLTMSSLTTWLVVKAVRDRDNPTTSFSVSDDPYDYPKVAVCLDYEKGCDIDTELTPDQCAGTMDIYFAQYGNSVHNASLLDRDDQGDLEDRCRVFDLPSAMMNAMEDDKDEGNSEGNAQMSLLWFAGHGNGDDDFTESVSVLLLDRSGGEPFEVSVPYSRMQTYNISSEPGLWIVETTIQQTTMFIGRTRMEYLDKSKNSAVYSALAMSTVTTTWNAGAEFQESSTTSRDWNYDSIWGHLSLQIVPSRFSNYRFKEDNPLDFEVLFGTVGGIWELLLLVTGVAFVTISKPPVRLRFRDVKKTYREARGVLSARKGKIQEGEALPEWDTAGGMSEEKQQMEDQQGRQARLASINLCTARFFRRPVVQETPLPIEGNVPGRDTS